jgi:hypothetical protein
LRLSGKLKGRTMHAWFVTSIFVVIAAASGLAQESKTLPLPLVSPRAVAGPVEPLSAEEKARLAFKNTFGTRALANRALLAGLNQWMDHPEEWESGTRGYGKRFASRMGRLAVRNAVQLSTDLAFKTDPRYDRCDCAGFLPRAGHAWRRVLLARRDSGGEMIGVSRLAGAYVTPMITDQWYPARLNTWSHKLESGTWFLGWRGVNNMLKEFWPDIKRTFRRNGG